MFNIGGMGTVWILAGILDWLPGCCTTTTVLLWDCLLMLLLKEKYAVVLQKQKDRIFVTLKCGSK